MKNLFCLLLLFIIGTLPVAAQDEQCIEYHSIDWVNEASLTHQINLDTGEITTSSYPGYGGVPTDEPFTATLEQNPVHGTTYTLTLTDNRVGITVVLAPMVTTYQIHWSPDGVWLAYVELGVSENAEHLRLFNTETGAIVSTLLDGERYHTGAIELSWSPNSNLITVSLLAENGAGPHPNMRVYSVPELTYLANYTFDSNLHLPTVRWSPSGNYLALLTYIEGISMVDTASWEIYTSDAPNINTVQEFFWSPDETYLAVTAFSPDNAYDKFAVVNMQGEAVIDTMLINRLGTPYWIDDTHLLIPTDDEPIRTGDYYDHDYDLTLLDVLTGEQSLVIEQAVSYRLSLDHRYLVQISNTDHFIEFFDFSRTDEFLIERITVEQIMFQYLWREDALELIVLFEDMSLRAYDLETQTWRDIASDIPHPGDDVSIYQAACSA